MPRIIVATDTSKLPDGASVLLDESVRAVHLASDHAATQLVERLAWAIDDAEAAEEARRSDRSRGDRPTPSRRSRSRSRSLHTASA
jgi:hypothetical protein